MFDIVKTDVKTDLSRYGMTEKIARFLETAQPATPCLIIDLDIVELNYKQLRHALPAARTFYAVKANPAPEILKRLGDMGACFDASSLAEVQMVLNAGVQPERISFGNTVKHRDEIKTAYDLGVRLFAFDSAGELDKLIATAPDAHVYCRIIMDSDGALWPLSRKFGCAPDMAADLLVKAHRTGLTAAGVSFHVGSQQLDTGQWARAIEQAGDVFRRAAAQGLDLYLLNLGGGIPASYRDSVPSAGDIAGVIDKAVSDTFGDQPPQLMMEPGRAIVASAGVLQTEVLLVARKADDASIRWVTVDVGLYGGLAEAQREAIQYPIISDQSGEVGPVVLCGPTCDSTDILYEKAAYTLPLDLREGDRLSILNTGAYTTTYASVGFNGFAPLKAYCL